MSSGEKRTGDGHGFCVDAATFTRVFCLSESRRVLPSGDPWRMVLGAGLNQVSVVALPRLTLFGTVHGPPA